MEKKEETDLFRTKFKHYKSIKSLSTIEDVNTVDNSCVTGFKLKIDHTFSCNGKRAEALGMIPCSDWKLYTLEVNPGLLFIRNPFTALGQRYWIRTCLEKYPRKPNKINIDNEMDVKDWWSECYENENCNKILQKKLRWATLGFHHNWDTKVYSDDSRTQFPEELAELTDVVAEYLGYQQFRAEAAIVNFYHMGSTLSAHTDHSEMDLEAPLFSFSFGQSAIFLIGGTDKIVEPSAILLQSGDIIVMTKQARVCYHAVPKILPSLSAPWDNVEELHTINSNSNNFKYLESCNKLIQDFNKNCENREWKRFKKYIMESRINVNVRQVLKVNQKCLLYSES